MSVKDDTQKHVALIQEMKRDIDDVLTAARAGLVSPLLAKRGQPIYAISLVTPQQ